LFLYVACSVGVVFVIQLCGSTVVVIVIFPTKKKNILALFALLGVVTFEFVTSG